MPNTNDTKKHKSDSEIDCQEPPNKKKETIKNRDEKISPHTLQNKSCQYSKDEFTATSRLLTDESPRAKYQRRFDQDKSTFHFGQRKLMLSEIEFLTNVSKEIRHLKNKKICLIYAGAAPGIHIAMLMNLFPFIEYILVDPAKFEMDCSKPTAKFQLINAFFTDDMAKQFKKDYKDYEILFVSDIRTADHRILSKQATEIRIEQDMLDQMRWVEILSPFKSMLKFRLPYIGDDKSIKKTELEYLDGKLFLQIWEGKTSSETRLVVDKTAGKKLYDCVKYEDQLFRFNTVERVTCYRHDVEAPGIDHCYDCRAEVFILNEYIQSVELIKEICLKRQVTYSVSYPSLSAFILAINKELNANRKTEGLKLTMNDKTNLYSVLFTDIYYGCDLNKLFNQDKIINRRFVKYNSSDDADEEEDGFSFNNSLSVHTSQNKKTENLLFSDVSRLLTDSFREKIRPKEIYQFNNRTTVHYRERSLRLGEIEFLTLACSELATNKELKFKNIVLIYAGAAPSKRLHHLHDMFPFVKFLLYDPIKLVDTQTSPMIEIKQELFTEETALEIRETYNDCTRLFISNIKRAKPFSSIENIQLETEDMQLQKRCHQNLCPFKSCLRFRVPYPENRANSAHEIDYLDGRVYFRLWSHHASMDTNLLVSNNAGMKRYSFMKYKNQLYRFNTVERVQCYRHDVETSGLDHCYDCRGEVYIFEMYLKHVDDIFNQLCRGKRVDGPAKKTLKNWLEELNEQLQSKEKMIQIELNKVRYQIKFTDIKYGKSLKEMISEKIAVSINESNSNSHRLDFRPKFSHTKPNHLTVYATDPRKRKSS